ncbi:hypothetical protein MNBD_GAMMA21-40 [hydrothermal vent metagenome]|uniref:Antitoxin Xre/MbcA/ParS-like toxin-binding domain-containing protein n=1 Tax=hydrothermal vent metagenome TaxID=652676 RepID=A0A3B0ZXF5_9ZZZZ
MVFEINHKLVTERQLSQSVLQITEMLGMYHAELARVLHLQCSDIGSLANGKTVLEEGSESWLHALDFLRFYQILYTHFDGDGVAMCNWMRCDHAELGKTPLLVMVDDLRIDDVVRLLN